jgi:hypothetical protein
MQMRAHADERLGAKGICDSANPMDGGKRLGKNPPSEQREKQEMKNFFFRSCPGGQILCLLRP